MSDFDPGVDRYAAGPDRRTTVADVVAPFGRLPAAAVALIADLLLDAVDKAHASSAIGLDLKPETLAFGIGGNIMLPPPANGPPWLLPPERARGQAPTARGDLFSVGALLLALLTGERALDAGSPQATAERLRSLRGPLPIAQLCPSVPGFLEALLLALLQADPTRRPANPQAARDIFADTLALLGGAFPGAIEKLTRDPTEVCAAMQQTQFAAEAQRGASLAAGPQTRRAAIVALLRANALTPGQPDVLRMLKQAADAGMVTGSEGRPPDVVEVLQQIAGQEPSPPPALLVRAANLLDARGELLLAFSMAKRALANNPADGAMKKTLADLSGPREDGALWQAGGPWVHGDGAMPIATAPGLDAGDAVAGAGLSLGDAPSFDTNTPKGQLVALLRSLADMYGGLDSRSRLFLMALSCSLLLTFAGVLLNVFGSDLASSRRTHLEALAQKAADCQPGGRVVLIKAYQAARLGEVAIVDQLISDNTEAKVPMGTRCHIYGMGLVGQAQAARDD